MSSISRSKSRATADAVVLSTACAAALVGAAWLDPLAGLAASATFLRVLLVVAAGLLGFGVFVWRRHGELRREIDHHLALEAERERLVDELDEALSRVRALQGILAMCSWCKNVRNPEGEWLPLESYLENNFQAHLSHGVCPECIRVQYPTLFGDP